MQKPTSRPVQSFDALWSRVTAGLGEQLTQQQEQQRAEQYLQQCDVHELQQLLGQVGQLMHGYRRQAARCTGASQRVLSGCAAALRRSAAQLQLEHYLLTGALFPAVQPQPEPAGRIAALRQLYLGECAHARSGRDAACKTGETGQAALYAQLADAAEARSQALRRLISAALAGKSA